ncbi:MAG: hypothetical protein IKP72_15365 [Clostridia bacterium]|nr:hypothetical protein [Clostridia bacterium]
MPVWLHVMIVTLEAGVIMNAFGLPVWLSALITTAVMFSRPIAKVYGTLIIPLWIAAAVFLFTHPFPLAFKIIFFAVLAVRLILSFVVAPKVPKE